MGNPDDMDDPSVPEEAVDESEVELQRLEQRLERLKEPRKTGDKQFARGLALVASFGFVLAGCLIGGLMLGEYLVKQTGQELFQLVGVILGLGTALFAGAKLLGPLMKSES